MHTVARSVSLVTVVLSLAACGGTAEPAPAQPAQPATAPAEPAAGPASGDADAIAGCVALFTRQRECTDVFIPALVSWRVELDVPAGIAARDQAEGRDALIAVAMEEYGHDSTDEAIAATCDQVVASIPAEQLAPMLDAGTACLAQETCDGFVACLAPLQQQRLRAQKAAEGG